MGVELMAKKLKGGLSDSYPIHFLANSANVATRSASCPFCVH